MHTYTYCHCREIRRWKTIEAESEKEADSILEKFLADDSANGWDELEDNDEGEVELREVDGEGVF